MNDEKPNPLLEELCAWALIIAFFVIFALGVAMLVGMFLGDGVKGGQ